MNVTKTSTRQVVCATLVFASIAASSPSHAYRLIQNLGTGRVTGGSQVTCTDPSGFAHWSSANVNWRHNISGVGGNPGVAAALYNAMNAWTFVTGANQSASYVGNTTAGFSTDGINSISWGSNSQCGSFNGCLALTALVLQSGQVIVESDVVFSTDWTWTTNGSNYDVRSVATHEFGHTLGIHHSDVPGATMYQGYTNQWSSLETDDKSALQCSQNRYPPTLTCIPDGGIDDTLYNTSCCSGLMVNGSTYCVNPADYNNGWASCYHICGSQPTANNCIAAGGIDDTLYSTSCCSGGNVPYSTRCLNPADYNNGWASCVQTCQ